jgi:hypothetical protein
MAFLSTFMERRLHVLIAFSLKMYAKASSKAYARLHAAMRPAIPISGAQGSTKLLELRLWERGISSLPTTSIFIRWTSLLRALLLVIFGPLMAVSMA